MLSQKKVLESFRIALIELRKEPSRRGITYSRIACLAWDIYCGGLLPAEKKPSLWTFRGYVLGRSIRPEILDLIERHCVLKQSRIDRARMRKAFCRAVEGRGEQGKDGGKRSSPRMIALIAHRHYCEGLSKRQKPPALVSFTQRVAGRTADPEILALLKHRNIENRKRTSLDRGLLLASFRECIEKLRVQIGKGLVKPVQIADGAHRLYVRNQDASRPSPSRLTFRSLVYSRAAYPEVSELLNAWFADQSHVSKMHK